LGCLRQTGGQEGKCPMELWASGKYNSCRSWLYLDQNLFGNGENLNKVIILNGTDENLSIKT
jgi:hypothetical protein